MIPAVWNLKVYDSLFEVPSLQNEESITSPGVQSTGSLLVDFNVDAFKAGSVITKVSNKGKLGGHFETNGSLVVKVVDGIKAAFFDGNSYLRLSKKAPACLDWNSPFTASVRVYNPETGSGECLMVWNKRDNMLQSSYAALMYGTGNYGAVAHGDGAVDLPWKEVPVKGKWHHIVVTFDGVLESVYVDGKLNTQTPRSLFVAGGDILIGASGESSENFSGYIANARLYDRAMTADEVMKLMKDYKPAK